MMIVIAREFVKVGPGLGIVPGEYLSSFVYSQDFDKLPSLFPSAVVEHRLNYRADVEGVVGLGIPDERRVLTDDILGGFELCFCNTKHRSYYSKNGG